MQLRHIAAAVLAAVAAVAVPHPAQAATFTAYEVIGDGLVPEFLNMQGLTDLWRLRGDSTGETVELNAATVAAENNVSANFGTYLNTSPITYTHDMNWVSPAWGTFSSATLSIFAFGADGNNDTVTVDTIDLGHLVGDGLLLGEWFTLSVFNGTADVLAQLNADGLLSVTIQKQGLFGGDPLNLVASRLFVEYEDIPVPEPTMLILLGAGLVGAATRARRQN